MLTSERCRYQTELVKAEKAGRKQGYLQGLGMGVTMMLIFFVDGLAFWSDASMTLLTLTCRRYSGRLVFNEGVSAGNCITVFFSVIIGIATVHII